MEKDVGAVRYTEQLTRSKRAYSVPVGLTRPDPSTAIVFSCKFLLIPPPQARTEAQIVLPRFARSPETDKNLAHPLPRASDCPPKRPRHPPRPPSRFPPAPAKKILAGAPPGARGPAVR